MASIFTYDPDPPRVASPWLSGSEERGPGRKVPSKPSNAPEQLPGIPSLSINEQSDRSAKVARLQPEPQAGPVEYKLHLLLRPRRKFRSTSTGSHVSGSKHSNNNPGQAVKTASEIPIGGGIGSGSATPPPASTQQTRQHRLEQLTTQLLWRLQQSSPYHTSSATNIILPSLPEALPELQAPQQLAKLLRGLEESQGALYEIGVSDDGTLVGLAEDELQESLNNLRAMAACLGCTVEILRKETVGECEWTEEMVVGRRLHQVRRSGKLVVAEAFIKPLIRPDSPTLQGTMSDRYGTPMTTVPNLSTPASSSAEQLRITLTGPTMSGKSTLLGTLTTSTLDNGRGKSRLSMLKHRHEITSGVTSSVTQELLGYQDGDDGSVDVINYAAENIASWSDIHVASAGSRMVLISDSAGHPRYRRTTLRGLVGWAPHWTLLCIPADDTEDTCGRTGGAGASQATPMPDMDLSGAQLDLCLRLGLPMVVVITKLDLASRAGLRESLSKVLDALKAAGRKPAIMPNTPDAVTRDDLQIIGNETLKVACNTAIPLLNDPRDVVPIVLTSAVDGSGIRNLHALLHELPLPDPPAGTAAGSHPVPPRDVFAIEDTYNKPAEVAGIIVSGRLRSGHVAVGDTLVIGPFSRHDHQEDSEDSDERPRPNRQRQQHHASRDMTSRSFPGALRDSPHLASLHPHHHLQGGQEWRRVTVVSIRNLRLPVHALHADQVGTVALVPDQHLDENGGGGGRGDTTSLLSRIRKGMVLTSSEPRASRSLGARFRRDDLESLAVGNHVVLYIGSIRASAKVLSARAPDGDDEGGEHVLGQGGSRDEVGAGEMDALAFDDLGGGAGEAERVPARVAGAVTAFELVVTFSFDAGKEFVVLGDQVLVMPGGGPGLYGGHERGEKGIAGLEGFVGEVVEVGE